MTGSGKTAAFLWPMIVHIMDQPHLQRGDGPIGGFLGHFVNFYTMRGLMKQDLFILLMDMMRCFATFALVAGAFAASHCFNEISCAGVILAPTRELCQQIHTEAKRFGKLYGINAAAVYGGGSKFAFTVYHRSDVYLILLLRTFVSFVGRFSFRDKTYNS